MNVPPLMHGLCLTVYAQDQGPARASAHLVYDIAAPTGGRPVPVPVPAAAADQRRGGACSGWEGGTVPICTIFGSAPHWAPHVHPSSGRVAHTKSTSTSSRMHHPFTRTAGPPCAAPCPLQVQLSNGRVAMVQAVDDSSVTLDLNHELAGKALTFDGALGRLAVGS